METILYKCEYCSKEIYTMEEYRKETEDVGYGFEWVVEHKDEFCNKLKLN